MPATRARVASHLPLPLRKLARRMLGYATADIELMQIDVVRRSGVFDAAWYVGHYPDVARSGVDPAVHYMKFGAREGRNPCELFDTRYYLRRNRDVAAAGINPLYHFCCAGHRELRNPSADFDSTWYWLTYLADSDPEANPLAHYLANGRVAGAAIRAVGALSAADKQSLADACDRLQRRDGQNLRTFVRIAMALNRLSRKGRAAETLRRATDRDWNNPQAHEQLAGMLERDGVWWQAVESLKRATQLDPAHADWFYRLGQDQEEMSRFAEAAAAFKQAIDLDASHADWYYRLGYAFEKSDQAHQAGYAYAEAIQRDENNDAKTLGIGAFHEARGYWPEAVEAYARELEEKPLDAELHYRLGKAHDRCYRWLEAARAYRAAIALRPQTAYWHYRYGFVLERQAQFAEAATAYAAAAELSSKHMPYWHYRHGYVLERAGKYEQACRAYLHTSKRQTLHGTMYDPSGENPERARLDAYLSRLFNEDFARRDTASEETEAERHYWLGERCEHMEDWDGAAAAYTDAVARSDPHRPKWYYRLGFALFRAQRYGEACNAFRQCRILQRPHGRSEKSFGSNATVRVTTTYVEYCETLPVRDDVMMYESTGGQVLTCNPLALFRVLIKHPVYGNFTHVWVLNDKQRIPPEYKKQKNVIFVTKLSDLYIRYLSTAKFLICNMGFPNWFIRRPEQKYLNTWHGTPLKTLGKEQKYKFYDHKWAQRTFLQATHLISPNPHMTRVMFDSYDLRGIYQGKLAETGYPRIDLELNATVERKRALRKYVGLDADRPVVLYAPTWRGTPDNVALDLDRLKSDIHQLAQQDCQLIFRGHRWMEQLLEDSAVGCAVVPARVDTNELLSVVDVLITDYSSICFDFFVTGRPILYYVYDQAEYEDQRGLYFSMDEMPGYKCKTIDSLCSSLQHALNGVVPDPAQYQSARAKYNPHDDGNATHRVLDFFLGDAQTWVVDPGSAKARTILFHGGSFTPNGITASFINLVNHIDKSENQLVLGFSPNVVERSADRMREFRKLPPDIAIVPRAGGHPLSWEERGIMSAYSSRKLNPSPEQVELLQRAYGREFTRMYGVCRFDVAITFSGYDAFWASIFNLNMETFRKIVYLHNDMYAEYRARYPELRRMFRLYQFADALVSVSPDINELNRSRLSKRYSVDPNKFLCCTNMINTTRIREQASASIDPDLTPLFHGVTTFLAIGRMSPEKDHSKLIDSFARLHLEFADTRLVVLGDGPLRNELERKVRKLGLENAICLAGQRANPFGAIGRCDCFVLPSNYEGQPMVLLEAMTLGKPIIATDIDGNRGVLAGGYGRLVENSCAGLVDGMRAFIRRELECKPFDAEEYQQQSLKTFLSVLRLSTPGLEREPYGSANATNVRSFKDFSESGQIVIANRTDGIGGRLNAILNGMYLAEKLNIGFGYTWPAMWNPNKVKNPQVHHAIVAEEKVFSPAFIEKYSASDLSPKKLLELPSNRVSLDQMCEASKVGSFAGWRAPGRDIRTVFGPLSEPSERQALSRSFRKIRFAAAIRRAISTADTVSLPPNPVAFHLRGGDVIYGAFRQWPSFTNKCLALPIAKALVKKVIGSGCSAIVFGQDDTVLDYLKREYDVYRPNDLNGCEFDSLEAQTVFELVLMSKCDYIVANKSWFAAHASCIGNTPIKLPSDFFSIDDQVKIIEADLNAHATFYDPLQVAFAYWSAYYYGNRRLSPAIAIELLTQASKFDASNSLYPIKIAVTHFREEQYSMGESALRALVRSEYAHDENLKLPSFSVLTQKLLGKFVFRYDFDYFEKAGDRGLPYASLMSYTINKSTGNNARASVFLDNVRMSECQDPVIMKAKQVLDCSQV